jgi:hypothetical protein
MNDLESSGNVIEAALWFTVSIVLLAKALRAEADLRGTFFILSAAFFAFSVSDLIESQTGAWWRPFWLLILKAGCIGVFVYGFRNHYKVIKRKNKSRNSIGATRPQSSLPPHD